jgi:alpha-tubulin suppressor-like RCC1 family protein
MTRRTGVAACGLLFGSLFITLPVQAEQSGSVVGWGDNADGQCSEPTVNANFVAIAAGGFHSLGLRADGTVAAWGENYDSQCDVVFPNTGFVAISAGVFHSLGLKVDGSIVAWGRNSNGQCNVPSPNTGFIAVAAGGYHSLGLKVDGSIVAWGDNLDGQCTVPSPNIGFTAIAAGTCHSLALKTDGSVTAWGWNAFGQSYAPSPNNGFLKIATGGHHNLGLRTDGSIVAWGYNQDGQCNVPEPNRSFVAISAHGAHSLGLKANGSVVGWGWNQFGQCNVPMPNMGFAAIAAGGRHSIGLQVSFEPDTTPPTVAITSPINEQSFTAPSVTVGGTASDPGSPSSEVCLVELRGNSGTWLPAEGTTVWRKQVALSPGSNTIEARSRDNFGNYSSIASLSILHTPPADASVVGWGVEVVGVDLSWGFTRVSTSAYHNLAITGERSIVAWGNNASGQCQVPSPNADFVAVAAGGFHSLGLKANGSIVAWGYNGMGQCDVPLPNSGFVAVSAGTYHSIGLKSDGSIVAWGDNSAGQVDVPSPNSGFAAVAAGHYHNLALTSDGSIVAWGASGDGRLNVPLPNNGFRAIAAGGSHSLGLRADGSIAAWGLGTCGQTWVPAPNTGFAAISAGGNHSLGVKADGSVFAWGNNAYGQQTVPSPGTSFASVAAGIAHSLGIRTDGSIVAWGGNSLGQCNGPEPNADFVEMTGSDSYTLGLKADGSLAAWGTLNSIEVDVPSPNAGFTTIASGQEHCLALRNNGSIAAWGSNDDVHGNRVGQCEVPSPNAGFVAVAAGAFHSLAIRSDGSVAAWGNDGDGQCRVPAPNTGFVKVSAGGNHSLGLKSDGSVVAWGRNDSGECNVPSPNTGFVAIAAGVTHSLGLKTDGSIVVWGSIPPVPAPNAEFVAIASGGSHSLGLKRDGSIAAWGCNANHQAELPSPNTGFVAIGASGYASYAIRARRLVTSSDAVSVSEGGTAIFKIKLNSKPSSNVVVEVSKLAGGDSDLSVSPTSLTFTSADWGDYQTVTVTATPDTDVANGQAIVRCAAPGRPTKDVAVMESDNTPKLLVTDTTTLNVPEGQTVTLRVKLSAQPGANVVVNPGMVAGGDPHLSVSPSSLTFTPANWDSYQTVTVTAAEDADAANGQATIRCTSSGWTTREVTVTEQDNDTLAIATSVSTVSIPEGATASFQVKLTAQPLTNLTVSLTKVAGSDPDIAVSSPSPATLTFTPANWDAYQTVTLAAAQDADVANGRATIRCSASGTEAKEVTATEQDDDTLAIVTDKTSLGIPEGGSASFQVRLSAQPDTNVTVLTDKMPGGDPSISVPASSLIFTPSNWNAYQSVTLSALDDPDAASGQATIRCSASGLANVDVTATEQENDTLAIATDKDSVTIPEGASASFQVKLAAQPLADVVVELSKTAGGDPDIAISSPSPATLTFTSSNWSIYQTVTLSAAEDADPASGQATVQCTASGITTKEVAVFEQDNDIQSIVTDTTSVTVPEGGTATFQVKLDMQPSGNVTVNVFKPTGDPDITVSSPASGTLTFTPENWSIFQTVTLAAAEDPNTVNGSATIRCSSSGLESKNITATEADNDSLSIVVDYTSVMVAEGGVGAFRVKLGAQPAGNLSVTIAKVAGGDPDISTSPGSLLFTTSNWNEYRTVTLSATEDADTANDQATIRCSAPGLADANVAVTEQDNDVLSIVTDNTSTGVPEGGSTSFWVRLNAQPVSNVTISVGKMTGGDPDISVSPTSLTFTTTTWNTYQAVTVSARLDADYVNGQATIRCSAAGLADRDVTVTETDQGPPATTWYRDLDSDGYGNPGESAQSVSQPVGYVSDRTDCNDSNAAIHPGATDIPDDGIDQDCSGSDVTTAPPPAADADGDGVTDATDACPATPKGSAIDAQGCSPAQRDGDGDGVKDDKDTCANTPAGTAVDANGCPIAPTDADADGVADDNDQCPGTPAGAETDAQGCAASQRDTDGDGVMDAEDQCAGTPTGANTDVQGCAASQRDSDGDGVTDNADQCPETPSGTAVETDGCPPDNPGNEQPRPSPFPFCGAGIVESMLVSIAGLALLQSRRRR